MAGHGNHVLTSSGVQELNTTGRTITYGPEALAFAEFHIHNSGPDLIRVTVTGSGHGTNEGYPLASGESETFRHTGSLFIRCPTATSGNPVTVDFIITTGA